MTIGSALILALTLLVIPIVILLLALFVKPGKINRLVGYRTKRSMASQEAWDYANARMVTLMKKIAIIMLIVTVLVGVVSFILYQQGNVTEVVYSIVVTVVILLQAICVCLPLPIIEKELKAEKYLVG